MKHTLSQKKIGQRIREIRLSRDIPQNKFAKSIGVSRQQAYYIETGQKGLTIPRLQKIERVLGIEPGTLLAQEMKTA